MNSLIVDDKEIKEGAILVYSDTRAPFGFYIARVETIFTAGGLLVDNGNEHHYTRLDIGDIVTVLE